MEAYNYFESEHVRAVLCMPFGTDNARKVLLIRANGLPENAHEAWLVAKLEGDMICVHCTCMAE